MERAEIVKHPLQILIVMHGVGLLGLAFEPIRGYFVYLSTFQILFCSVIVLGADRAINSTNVILLIVIAICGFLIEVMGVSTGWPFGDYHYGGSLLGQVFGVPLIIGLNWALLVYCGFQIALWMRLPRYIRPLICSLLLIGLDLLIEPVAIRLDYWQWDSGSIPIENYLAWMIIALIFAVILEIRPPATNRVAVQYFGVLIAFFSGLNLIFLLEAVIT